MDIPQILIVDLGSQYTQLIKRRLLELGVRSETVSAARAGEWLALYTPKGIILSGGAKSIKDFDAPRPPDSVLTKGVPVLGICLGEHWLVDYFGGSVSGKRVSHKEYWEAHFAVGRDPDELFVGLPQSASDVARPAWMRVWMSHGDNIGRLPECMREIGFTGSYANRKIAAVRVVDVPVWGIQFHPEVTQTEHGKVIFANFLSLCKIVQDWSPGDRIAEICESVFAKIGAERRCIIGYSGGVDSTVLTVILKPVLGERLESVTIDAGNLRKDELKEILANARYVGTEPRVIECSKIFFDRFSLGMTNPEWKRKFFSEQYRRMLECEGMRTGSKVLLQGTLAPDRIESGVAGESSQIKLHHNMLKSKWFEKVLHPLGELFKDEVRELGRHLGLPSMITERMPFPGPGLFCRVVGVPITRELVEIVRWADAEVESVIYGFGLERDISQLVVALDGTRATVVKGDGGGSGYQIIVRAVETVDYMTARGVELPSAARNAIKRALAKHPDIARVNFNEDANRAM